jgi:hypothetical protein
MNKSPKREKKRSLVETMHAEGVQKAIEEQAKKLQSKLRKVVTGDEKKRIRDRIRETQDEPKYVKFFDKVAFTVGVLNMGVCQYFLLNRPDMFPMWYALVMPLVLGSRYLYFHNGGLQYFMIDFCYFSIFCSMMNLLFITNSPLFFKVCFICCTGPLTLAIPVWRNSFVFHDYDKIVSVYIHILPAMLYYTLRHTGSSLSNGFASVGLDSSKMCQNGNCEQLLPRDYLITLVLYLFWQASYLLKTEYMDKDKLDRNPKLLTSLRWLASDTKNALARLVLRIFRWFGVFGREEDFDSKTMKTKAVFVTGQLMFTLISFLPTPFMYYSSTFHLIYILLILTTSIFNGASFYIEVFSKRYNSHIIKIEEMHQIAQAATKAMNEIAALQSTDKLSPLGSAGNSGTFSASGVPLGATGALDAACRGSSAKSSSASLHGAAAAATAGMTRSFSGLGNGTSSSGPHSPAGGRGSSSNGLCGPTGESSELQRGAAGSATGAAAGAGTGTSSGPELSQLTALLKETSDNAWHQIKRHYQRVDEMRSGKVMNWDEDEYEVCDKDLLSASQDEMDSDQEQDQEQDHETEELIAEGLTALSHDNGDDEIDEGGVADGEEEEDQEGGDRKGGFSPLSTRDRGLSIMSIDR